ncbi:MAG TPA: MFS transporter [Caulobacteraceae bacterium]|jgi:Na+/melibiose symporter-like transporter
MTAQAEAATTLATPEPTDLAASGRNRILIYLGVLVFLVGFGAPNVGLVDIPISFFLKNRLHLKAHEVATFRLISGLPLYFGFLWGFVRDIWNPFGRRDRGYMMLFGAIGAIFYLFAASVPPTQATLLIAVIVLTSAFLFVQSAQTGLGATIARQHVMTGQMSTVMNVVTSIAVLIPFSLGGYLSTQLEGDKADTAAHAIFLVGAVAMAAIAIFAIWRPRVVYDNVHAEQKAFHPLQDAVRLFKHWPVYPALAIWLLWNFAPGSATPLQYYLQDTLHGSDAAYGNWNAIFGGCFIPTYLLYGALCRRVKLRTLLFWGTVVAVPQMTPLLLAKTVPMALVMAAPIGLMGGVATAAYLDLLIRSCPRGLEGTIIMASNALYFFVSRVGDILGTSLYDHFHTFTVCVIAITVVYALILPTLLLVPKRLTATPDGVAPEGGFDAETEPAAG